MHSEQWKNFAAIAALAVLGALGGCDEGAEGPFGPDTVEDENDRGDFKILVSNRTAKVDVNGRNCDAQAWELPLAVEFEPAETPQQEQDIIDNLEPYDADLDQACAADPAMDAECAMLCPANGCAWMPGGSITFDPQSVSVVVGDLMPTGVCEDQSEQVSANVEITGTCACICGEPLQPDPPQ